MIPQSARAAMLDGLADPDLIRFRQAVLRRLPRQPAIGAARSTRSRSRRSPTRSRSTAACSASAGSGCAPLGHRARAVRRERSRSCGRWLTITAPDFISEGFQRFFETLRRELDDEYFEEIAEHLQRLRFRGGVLATARLGKHGQGVEYVLRAPRRRLRILAVRRCRRSRDPRSAIRSRRATRAAGRRSGRCATGCSASSATRSASPPTTSLASSSRCAPSSPSTSAA